MCMLCQGQMYCDKGDFPCSVILLFLEEAQRVKVKLRSSAPSFCGATL